MLLMRDSGVLGWESDVRVERKKVSGGRIWRWNYRQVLPRVHLFSLKEKKNPVKCLQLLTDWSGE